MELHLELNLISMLLNSNSYGLFMSVLPIFKTGSSVYRMLYHFRFVLNAILQSMQNVDFNFDE